MNEKLAVIILNYYSYKDTLNLIKSIDKYDPGLCIIVVDNSCDNTERQKLSPIKERCILIFLDENGGYAAGNNAGIKKAVELGYDTFLIANSDTYLASSNAISDCYIYMKKNDIGILGPRMVNEAGEDVSGCIDVDKYGRTKHYYTDEIRACKCLTGAFIFIDKKVIDKIGFIREFYFLYREETDYCVRAYENNVKIVYYPHISIVHKEAATTKKIADYYYHRNMFIFSREIYKTGSFQLALFYFFRYILNSIKIIKTEKSNKELVRKLKQIWYAYFDGIRDVRGKRKI